MGDEKIFDKLETDWLSCQEKVPGTDGHAVSWDMKKVPL